MSTNTSGSPVPEDTTSCYEQGFRDGAASRQDEIDAIERIADAWYYRANNPKSEWPEAQLVNSIIEAREANEERERKWAELDRVERELFEEARALINSTDLSDLEIAVKVGLFVPIVANIREGVL